MAKKEAAATQRETKPTGNGALTPTPNAPLHELFYLIGYMRGAGVEGSVRLAELVNELLAQPSISEPETEA